jgi:hypothetical protein
VIEQVDVLADRFWLAYFEYLPTVATVRRDIVSMTNLSMFTEKWGSAR